MIAVTGATGELGGRVARRLADRGTAQVLVVRDPTRAPQLEGAEVRQASGFGDGLGMREALRGVETLFMVPAGEAPNRAQQHATAVDAARDAGVGRIVYLSFVGAAPDCTFTFARDHWATEEHIRSTGLAYVFPRMSMYMDFIPLFADEDGVIRGPAGDGRVAAVLRDDVADACVAILIDPAEHDGQTYNLTGPEAFRLAEVAGYEAQTPEQARVSRIGQGEDWEIEGWVSSYEAIANGELDVVTEDVQRLTGHPPTGLRGWLGTG